MKKLFILFLLVNYSCNKKTTTSKNTPNEGTNDLLKEAIIKIVKGFKEKNAASINELIHPETKLYVLYRAGVFDEFTQTDKIAFNSPVPEYFPYSDFLTDYNVNYETSPAFDCETEAWDKFGLYCDTKERSNLLSETAENLKKYADENRVTDTEIEKLKSLEEKSKRVVLTDKNNGELIFYLTLINNAWYFTILDRVTSDCDS